MHNEGSSSSSKESHPFQFNLSAAPHNHDLRVLVDPRRLFAQLLTIRWTSRTMREGWRLIDRTCETQIRSQLERVNAETTQLSIEEREREVARKKVHQKRVDKVKSERRVKKWGSWRAVGRSPTSRQQRETTPSMFAEISSLTNSLPFDCHLWVFAWFLIEFDESNFRWKLDTAAIFSRAKLWSQKRMCPQGHTCRSKDRGKGTRSRILCRLVTNR